MNTLTVLIDNERRGCNVITIPRHRMEVNIMYLVAIFLFGSLFLFLVLGYDQLSSVVGKITIITGAPVSIFYAMYEETVKDILVQLNNAFGQISLTFGQIVLVALICFCVREVFLKKN